MLRIVISNQTNPYWNVAVENYLLGLPADGVVTLYLWKNRRTVVIGQNQNPFAECDVDLLQADGGYVMRRVTGGGAVYHDDGNINFSFVAPKDLYDQQRQFSVVRKAVESYGLETELSGRNDILCRGRKFSGNAFSKGRQQNLHHGTILIRSNVEDLQRYLKVKPAKLQKHGVTSVRSRVVNLSELVSPTPERPEGITSDNIVRPLVEAFEMVYGERAAVVDFDQLMKEPEVRELYQKFVSDDWIFGRWRNFTAQKSAQFEWGGVDISLDIDEEHSIIRSVEIASDGLNLDLIEQARKLLVGASTKSAPQTDDSMMKDIFSLIY